MADAPKIQIDSDWKAEAQKEKERLAKKEQSRAPAAGKSPTAPAAEGSPAGPAAGGAHGEKEPLPPADFHTLVGMLAQQAIMGLGVMADKKTGGIIVDLEGSRFAIDLLDVLEQKTRGNLGEEESRELTQILSDLRARFVQIATLVSQQMAKQGAGGVEAIPASAIPAASPIITE